MGLILFVIAASAFTYKAVAASTSERRNQAVIRDLEGQIRAIARERDGAVTMLAGIQEKLNSPAFPILWQWVNGGKLPGNATKVVIELSDGSQHHVNENVNYNGGRRW